MTLPPQSELTANISRVFDSANPDEQRLGRDWYSDAREYCASLAREHGLTLEQSASIVAALSPNTAWGLNKRDAARMLDYYRRGLPMLSVQATTYRRNLEKAWRIRETGDTSHLRGPKVTAFRDCILSPTSRAVCIDVHSVCVALGKEYTIETVPRMTPKTYRAIADAYRAVARQHGIAPYRVQATCWAVRRRTLEGTRDQSSLPLR